MRKREAERKYRSRAGALNFCSMTSWTTSASFFISSGVRTPLIISIFTRGILIYLMDFTKRILRYSGNETMAVTIMEFEIIYCFVSEVFRLRP